MWKAGIGSGTLLAMGGGAVSLSGDSLGKGGGIGWKRSSSSRPFASVTWDAEPLVAAHESRPGLLDGYWRTRRGGSEPLARVTADKPSRRSGPVRATLQHQLHDTGAELGEDLLEATLTLRNESSVAQAVEVGFASSVHLGAEASELRVYLPLNAAGLTGDQRFAALGVADFLRDCNQVLRPGAIRCHYLEPAASFPEQRETQAQILAPVVDLYSRMSSRRVGFFTPSDQPRQFQIILDAEGKPGWRCGRGVVLPPGAMVKERAWLLLHHGDAEVAWRAFHRFAHREEHSAIDWVREFKVHYYDFLSSAAGKNGRRGDGYEAAIPLFRKFRVGLATQHGYYPTLGDYIHPDRKAWRAMRGDKQGAVEMSIAMIQDRLQATRQNGAKAAIYLHPVLFDDATPFFEKMKDCVLVGADGEPVPFPWQGPDTVGRNWRASLASPEWREHLLQQTAWIMEILQPDAICVDETFAGIGYDHHPNHPGPTSAAAIDWHRDLRSLVRSFGSDRAVFTSDCSMSPFVLWADGEVGDHAYPGSLGNPLYRQEPVRYLAALGEKPWRPCAWHFTKMWNLQMKLARQVGSGVGVANGWLEYTGLHGLTEDRRTRLLADIESLF